MAAQIQHLRRIAAVGVQQHVRQVHAAAPRVLTGELTALLRFHYERARTQIIIGSTPTAEAGDPRDDEVRNGYALAAALQSRFSLWERLHITPGLRVESFWSDRRIQRVPVTRADGLTIGTDTDRFGRAASFALIPGLGLSAQVAGPLTLYGGVHRGYAPPRTQDAVSPAGQNLELDPERFHGAYVATYGHVGWTRDSTSLGRLWLNPALSLAGGSFSVPQGQSLPPSFPARVTGLLLADSQVRAAHRARHHSPGGYGQYGLFIAELVAASIQAEVTPQGVSARRLPTPGSR